VLSGSQPRIRDLPASKSKRQSKAIKHAFGFLDETGTLGSGRDPFFAVGLLRCPEPYDLLRPIQRIRDKQHFYDEIKWSKVSIKKLPLLKALIDVFLSSDASFSALVCDKREHDIIERFGGQFPAYDFLARQLIWGSIHRGEIMWVVADEYSTPPGHHFEENVRDYVNSKVRRDAVAGVCRMRSSGVDLLQLIDLLLGAVVYEYKAERGVVGLGKYKPKVQLLDYLKQQTGVTSFVGGHKDGRLNIQDYCPPMKPHRPKPIAVPRGKRKVKA
jgi:hypothetical protein